jgi:hypothetical protein
MCSCKITQCKNAKCSCFKNDKKCSITCKCVNCENKLSKMEDLVLTEIVEEEEEPILDALDKKLPNDQDLQLMVDSLLDDNEIFNRPLVCITWNMCHFSSFCEKKLMLLKMTKLAFDTLIVIYSPDIIVLQEFPASTKYHRLELLKSMIGKEYLCEASNEPNHEHVFIWKIKTVRPFKPKLDESIRYIHKSIKRPGGTMRLFHIPSNELIFVTSVHLSSKKELAHAEFKLFFEEYDARMNQRFGDSKKNLHIVLGDFNFNPHKELLDIQDKWKALGDIHTKTTIGEKGFDFVFINKSFVPKVSASTHVLVQTNPKNSAMSKHGITDHDPVVLSISFFRKDKIVLLTKDEKNKESKEFETGSGVQEDSG